MFDYGEACPISMAASLLCEKWTLQILREMYLGSTRYSEFQKYLPNISPSLLKSRLRTLEEHGVIMRKTGLGKQHAEYYLTASGKALGPLLTEMGKWGMRWASSGMTERHNTVEGLMRDISSAIDISGLPTADTIIQFTFTDLEECPKYFINVQKGTPEVCSLDMGYDVDVYMTGEIKTFTRIWYGELSLDNAVQSGLIKLVANSQYMKSISQWFGISSFTTPNPKFTAPA